MNLGSHALGALGWADEMDEGKQKDSASGALVLLEQHPGGTIPRIY